MPDTSNTNPLMRPDHELPAPHDMLLEAVKSPDAPVQHTDKPNAHILAQEDDQPERYSFTPLVIKICAVVLGILIIIIIGRGFIFKTMAPSQQTTETIVQKNKRTEKNSGKVKLEVVHDKGKAYVIVNGIRERKFDSVTEPVLSPDKTNYAYIGKPNSYTWYVVLNGKREKPYDFIDNNLVFSLEGNKLGYRAIKGSSEFVVIDGKESEPYTSVSVPVFNSDGSSSAYVVTDGQKKSIYVAGKFLADGSDPLFSPQNTLVYAITNPDGTKSLMMNGKKGKAYSQIQDLTFSPDGKHIVYAASTKSISPRVFVVIDGKEQTPVASIYPFTKKVQKPFVFSKDGKKLTYSIYEKVGTEPKRINVAL